MRKKCNFPVRELAEEKGLFLWEVAQIMGISYSGFLNRMRFEWSEDEQKRVCRLIEDYARNEGQGKS